MVTTYWQYVLLNLWSRLDWSPANFHPTVSQTCKSLQYPECTEASWQYLKYTHTLQPHIRIPGPQKSKHVLSTYEPGFSYSFTPQTLNTDFAPGTLPENKSQPSPKHERWADHEHTAKHPKVRRTNKAGGLKRTNTSGGGRGLLLCRVVRQRQFACQEQTVREGRTWTPRRRGFQRSLGRTGNRERTWGPRARTGRGGQMPKGSRPPWELCWQGWDHLTYHEKGASGCRGSRETGWEPEQRLHGRWQQLRPEQGWRK